MRHLRDRLLLAGGEGRAAAGSDPDDVMQVQVPDAWRDQLARRLDLDHARLEPGDVALGGRARGEDAGAARTLDLLRVRAGLGAAELVQVLAGMDRDRVGPAAVGGHPRVAALLEELVSGARGRGDEQQHAKGEQQRPPDQDSTMHAAIIANRSALADSARPEGPRPLPTAPPTAPDLDSPHETSRRRRNVGGGDHPRGPGRGRRGTAGDHDRRRAGRPDGRPGAELQLSLRPAGIGLRVPPRRRYLDPAYAGAGARPPVRSTLGAMYVTDAPTRTSTTAPTCSRCAR